MSEPLPVLEYERVNWEDAPSRVTPLSADNLNNMDNAIAALCTYIYQLEDRVADLENHPAKTSHVGMIIMSTTLDTMEKVIEEYGGTTWLRITGKFLLGATYGESSQYPVNATGGFRNSIVPEHAHAFSYTYETNSAAEGGSLRLATVDTGGYNFGQKIVKALTKQTNSTGVSAVGRNMPPYVAVYIWQRTE